MMQMIFLAIGYRQFALFLSAQIWNLEFAKDIRLGRGGLPPLVWWHDLNTSGAAHKPSRLDATEPAG
jgi:hypothetical protein